MFEDDMTEQNLATTAEDYYRVTDQERHEERMAVAQAYIRSLEATIFMLKHRRSAEALVLPALFGR